MSTLSWQNVNRTQLCAQCLHKKHNRKQYTYSASLFHNNLQDGPIFPYGDSGVLS